MAGTLSHSQPIGRSAAISRKSTWPGEQSPLLNCRAMSSAFSAAAADRCQAHSWRRS